MQAITTIATPGETAALGPTERQAVLDVLHSPRFVDQSPTEVHATLLEEQTYLCSPRTMYRVLAAAHEVRERRAQARHPAYAAPELVATGPNQVWSWDITKLKGQDYPTLWRIPTLSMVEAVASRVVISLMGSADRAVDSGMSSVLCGGGSVVGETDEAVRACRGGPAGWI